MFRSVSSEVRLFSILASLALAALGLLSSSPALAGHSTSTATSSGTSTCKLCTLIDWQIEVGDLDVAFQGAPNWDGTIVYTSRPGQTITGKVCFAATQQECLDNPALTDTAEFVITEPGVSCTGYVESSCSRSGKQNSIKTFTQQCGQQAADCVGRLEAATNGINGLISPGQGVNIGGAAALTTSTQCAAVFPQVKGKGGTPAGLMGTIVQLHVGSRSCNASVDNIVDQKQDQKACSSAFDSTEAGSCFKGEPPTLMPAGISLNQSIIGAVTAQCLPGSMQQICDVNRDEGKHRILFTGAALALQGVSANDVNVSSFLCGNQITPISVSRGDTDNDGLDDFDVRCFTCDVPNSNFLCAGGQCELTGTDGQQPFAALCPVTLTP